jgi:hypothetical protein
MVGVDGESRHSRWMGMGQMAPRRCDPEQLQASASRNSGKGWPSPRSRCEAGWQCAPGCGLFRPPGAAAPRAGGKIAAGSISCARLDLTLASFMQCSHASHSADRPRCQMPSRCPDSVQHRSPRLLRARRPGIRATQEESMASRRWRPTTTSGYPFHAYIHTPRRTSRVASPATSEW